MEDINELHKEKYGWEIEYRTMGGYIDLLRKQGIGINYVPLVGHGTIKYCVMGEDYKRAAKPE